MALNYTDQANLRVSQPFQNRISVAISKYAGYLLGAVTGSDLVSKVKLDWASSVIKSGPTQYVAQLIELVIWDAAVVAMASPVDQSSLADSSLQIVVENSINNSLLKVA
jgi:hypothetical protein